MKSIILVAFALVAVAVAAPTENKPIEILSSSSETLPDGSYSFRYETEDGSSRSETGTVKEAPNEENKLQKVVIVSGSYTYLNDNGNSETITYYADENGFHAEGDSIPKLISRR